MPSIPERNIHLDLWRILRDVIIKEKFTFEDTEFVDVKFEPNINGKPDLVIEAVEKGKAKKIPLLVIETKRKEPYPDPRFDPYSMKVIEQAVGYATKMGAPYFATCNGEILVVFDTFTVGVPLIQRRVKQYKVFFEEEFARTILKELVRFRLGKGKWLPLDDIFVERLRSFHRFITPFIYEALNEKVREDPEFKEEYAKWLTSQLFEYSDEINKNVAEQMAYLLMNKIAFYKTLETQIPELTELKEIDALNGAEFSEKLQGRFKELVSKADYEGIFQPTILDKVSLPDKLVYHLNEFIEELGVYNLAKIRSDVLGRVYEDLIPSDERHRLGQYYTPPPIVELIVEMCVESPDDKVLDPACGSGGFLVKTYHKLRDLKKKEKPFIANEDLHQEILEQIYGIDINPFPAQLSSINLAVRNLKVRSKHINLLPSDFFKVNPSQPPLPERFDVVVTNPPYTRQEEMEYKAQIRDVALTSTDGSKIKMSARAGIYAYFFTHSAKFLANGGRMGYITSNTWLDVGFGKDLKKFFLDHFIITCIIEFDGAIFGRALVNTCVSILEKIEDIKVQETHLVKFVRLKKAVDIDKLIRSIRAVDEHYEDDKMRIVPVRQVDLEPKEKWGKYLRAPSIYFKILHYPKMTPLRERAKIRRGITTGSNDFFILDKEKTDVWGIEPKYLKPVISSVRDIEHITVEPQDSTECVLMVHKPKDRLEENNVLKYIEHGESLEITTKRGTRIASEKIQGIHNLRTCKGRKIWYDLGEREPAPILFPYLMWEQTPFIWNKAKAYVTDVFHEIYPHSEEDFMILLGILNSTLTSFLLELHGRSYGGGVLKTQVYELENLPIFDPNRLEAKEKNRVQMIFLKLCKAQRKEEKEIEKEAKMELDSAIFDALGLTEDERMQVYEGLKSMRQMRLQRKEVEVLVETEEEWKPRKKRIRKRRIVEEKPTKRLDIWMEKDD